MNCSSISELVPQTILFLIIILWVMPSTCDSKHDEAAGVADVRAEQADAACKELDPFLDLGDRLLEGQLHLHHSQTRSTEDLHIPATPGYCIRAPLVVPAHR